jgi:HK97 family phage major capsid protein
MLQHLRDRAAKALHDARAILEAADKASRALTTEEQTTYDNFMGEFDSARDQVKRAERLAEAEAAVESRGPQAGRTETAVRSSADILGSPEYRSAFWSAIRTGQMAPEFRALALSPDSGGGYTVPDEFRRQLLIALEQANVMRPLATTFRTASGVMSIPVLSTHASAAWTNEAADYTEGTSVFSEVQLNAFKSTCLMKSTEEFINDSFINVESFVAVEMGRALGRLEETAFFVGTGSNQPTGVVGSATLGKTATATNAITADELMDTQYALGRQYRSRATWIMHDSTIKAIRKLQTGVSGDKTYLWAPGLSANEPDRLLGNPVVASQDMAEIATGNKTVLFGDFSYYYIGERSSMALQRLNELYAVSGHIGFRVHRRLDAKLALTEAVKYLVQA